MAAVGEKKQIPGLAGFGGCWKCGSMEHRAADCPVVAAEQAEQWLAMKIADEGEEQALMALAQVLAGAKQQAQQIVEKRQQQQEATLEEQRREAERRRQQQQRYAEQRRVRQAQVAARRHREKARSAMAAVRRGEYPKPKAAIVEAKADVKEAEAKRRAAARRKQQAYEMMHDASVERDVAGMAQHRYLDAQVEERNAVGELQAAQEKKQAAQVELARQRQIEQKLELERQKQQTYLDQQWQNLFQIPAQNTVTIEVNPTAEVKKQSRRSRYNAKRRAKANGMIPLDGDV